MLLHDVASCAHEWDEVARPLAERFRVLALDLRGHGESLALEPHYSLLAYYPLLPLAPYYLLPTTQARARTRAAASTASSTW